MDSKHKFCYNCNIRSDKLKGFTVTGERIELVTKLKRYTKKIKPEEVQWCKVGDFICNKCYMFTNNNKSDINKINLVTAAASTERASQASTSKTFDKSKTSQESSTESESEDVYKKQRTPTKQTESHFMKRTLYTRKHCLISPTKKTNLIEIPFTA